MKLKIITTPEPLLRKASKPIKRIDKKIARLAEAMLKLLQGGKNTEPLGVGLSAVQVNRPVRLMIVYDQKQDRYLTMINPEIIQRSKKMTSGLPEKEGRYEGCLSVPGYYGLVKRHEAIQVRYLNLASETQNESFAGYTATIIQHELDHLDGILFIDRVLEQKGKLYEIQDDEDKLVETAL